MRPGALGLLVVMLLLAGCTQKTSVAPETSPVPATGPALGNGEWAAVACGTYHTLAVKQDGSLWAWGLNDYGQLGRGMIDTRAHATPTQVGHDRDWVSVSAGYGDSFGVRRDGTLWAWGDAWDWGANLGLGEGDWEDRYAPTRVARAHGWAAVFYGYFHGLALKKDSTLWAWGANFYGALGVSYSTLGWSPAKVGSDGDWAAAAAGGDFSLALKKDGTLWAWGVNVWGNLGLGDTTNRQSPIQVGQADDWAAVSAGICYGLALKEDGTLWAWGANSFGELGLGDTDERHSPTRVGSANDWAAVHCLGHHSLALKKDGTLWAWGENSFGQLGLGDTADRHTPTQVGSAHDWAAIASGAADSYHTQALKSDGSLWAWGFNQFGQLGPGDTRDRHAPTEVGSSQEPGENQ